MRGSGTRARIALGIVALLATCLASAPSTALSRVLDVAAENALPGTPKWSLSSRAFTGKTLAFADRASVRPGENVGLYVQCRAQDFTVRALRIGDYGGAGARGVWSGERTRCMHQTAPRVDTTTNTAVAQWTRTLEVPTTDWPEGMYVFVVKADDGSGTYVDLVLRSEEAKGRVLLVSSTQTFQAYNQWGGANAYRGEHGGFSKRARVVTYDRPNTWGQGAGKFLGYEAPLVRRAEALGLPLAYAADVDLATNPGMVTDAASIVFGGHAEYWTQRQRDAVLKARDHGTNLLFFGANTAYWRVRLSASDLGANRVMAIWKSRSQDPDKAKPSIRFRDLGQPDSELTGVTYSCFPVKADLRITHADSWVFEGTGVRNGETLTGIVGPEVDKLVTKTPADDVLASSSAKCGTHTTHSTMLLRKAKSGAATFAVGTMGWVSKALKGEAPAASVAFVRQVTDNVLRAATTRGLAG